MRFSKILIPITAVLLAGCSAVAALQPTATPTATPEPPTPTPVPAAAVVNGEIIPLADYSASLQQLQAAQQEAGKPRPRKSQQQVVLDDLIAQTLLAQAAVKAGHRVDDAALQVRIDQCLHHPRRAGKTCRLDHPQWL